MAHVLEPEASLPIGTELVESPASDLRSARPGSRSASRDVAQVLSDQRRPVQRAVKRGFDIVAGMILILLVLPFALVVALAIALDSRGPILFMQRRVGRNGVEFRLIKFRTMVSDAESALVQHIGSDEKHLREWERSRKLRHDPRITRVGGFLRRFSLDELPQLLNVVRGSMSLVGPRPVPQDEVPYFGECAPYILNVRPGLTGLWAVSGRSTVSYQERVELEFRYAVGWSLWMDAGILLRTIPAVVRGHGAY
jgi:exopolysaccharide production protein ExoY